MYRFVRDRKPLSPLQFASRAVLLARLWSCDAVMRLRLDITGLLTITHLNEQEGQGTRFRRFLRLTAIWLLFRSCTLTWL